MTWSDAVFLAVAGVLGGLTGSIAGLASVATYPALLMVGLAPVTANITNTVALVFNGIGSALGSRPELTRQWVFALLAPVNWLAVLAVGVGCLAGSRIGPVVVRRVPAGPTRIMIGVAGLALAVKLGVDTYG